MLLTIIEAAEKLRTTPGAARRVLDRLKVKPFNLGPGRGLGLRWDSYEIDSLEAVTTPYRSHLALAGIEISVRETSRDKDGFTVTATAAIKKPRHS